MVTRVLVILLSLDRETSCDVLFHQLIYYLVPVTSIGKAHDILAFTQLSNIQVPFTSAVILKFELMYASISENG